MTQSERSNAVPPAARSRTAHGLATAAAEGRFALQVCADCGTVQYPPREACAACLSARLAWRDVPAGGQLIAATTLHVSTNSWFRAHLPWRIGAVVLDCGPSVIAHLHQNVAAGARVRMMLRIDKSGHGVMLAMPAEDTPDIEDDRQFVALTKDPDGRDFPPAEPIEEDP